jgi:hypothetical protein
MTTEDYARFLKDANAIWDVPRGDAAAYPYRRRARPAIPAAGGDDEDLSCPICEGGKGSPCNSHFL